MQLQKWQTGALSVVQLFVIPWTVALQASVHGIFQARILERLPFPPPGHLPDPVIELVSPMSPALAGGFLTTKPPEKSYMLAYHHTMQFLYHPVDRYVCVCVCVCVCVPTIQTEGWVTHTPIIWSSCKALSWFILPPSALTHTLIPCPHRHPL